MDWLTTFTNTKMSIKGAFAEQIHHPDGKYLGVHDTRDISYYSVTLLYFYFSYVQPMQLHVSGSQGQKYENVNKRLVC